MNSCADLLSHNAMPARSQKPATPRRGLWSLDRALHALVHGATLVTNNERDLERTAELRIENIRSELWGLLWGLCIEIGVNR